MGSGKKRKGTEGKNEFEDEYMGLPTFSVRFAVFKRKKKKNSEDLKHMRYNTKAQKGMPTILFFHNVGMFIKQKMFRDRKLQTLFGQNFPFAQRLFHCTGVKYQTDSHSFPHKQ